MKNRGMNKRFTLDVPSFQKLLEAAWVLQCDRDRELSGSRVVESDNHESDRIESDSGVTVLAVSSDTYGLNAALALSSRADVFEPAKSAAEACAVPICEIAAPSAVPKQLTVAPIYPRAEVAGALALAPDPYCPPLGDAGDFPAPDVFEKSARRKNRAATGAQFSRRATLRLVRSGDQYRVSLRLVPPGDKYQDKEHTLSKWIASTSKRASLVTMASAAPAVALLTILAFSFLLLGIHRPALAVAKAPALVPKIAGVDSGAQDYVGLAQFLVTGGRERPRADRPVTGSPALAPNVPDVSDASHLKVTDPATASLVEGLSRYEMQTLRRQAQYGDDVAALTLGMAYEIGHLVPQSCTQAAHWVAVAAEEGNSAAQYNLALRYVSGDGTPSNRDEARKWVKEAAEHGYHKARLTLQDSGL